MTAMTRRNNFITFRSIFTICMSDFANNLMLLLSNLQQVFYLNMRNICA